MRHTMFQRLAAPGLILCSLALAQCGGAGAGTAPSSTPAPVTPAPTPAPSPGGGATPVPSGSSLSVTPSSIQGQGQPQATITLASAAPNGGALVLITSSDSTVARVPATVTVAAGSRSVTFLVDTSTVVAPATVTITASYAGTMVASTLTVLPPTLSAAFVVRSPLKGLGACMMESSTQELDCVLDGNASQGFIRAWMWTYTMGGTTLRHTAEAPNAASSPQTTGCAFLQQGTGGDKPDGSRYLKMDVTLQVRDSSGVTSRLARPTVKV